METDLPADGDDVLVRGDRTGRKARSQLEHLLIIPDRLDPPEFGYEHRPVVAPCDGLGLCARRAGRAAEIATPSVSA
jgi:hypothetical protein